MEHTSPKLAAELAFWQSRLRQQGVLSNDHFEHFFTTHFGLDQTFYRGKRLLDIGCGPRGSLEWATAAAVRIGIDPLAVVYGQLGASAHAMRYVACGAEHLPFPSAAFDVVSAFNALDHVDDLPRAAGEIARVLAPHGDLLLITDIHPRPTLLEPSATTWELVHAFGPALALLEQRQVEQTVFSPEGYGDIYQSLRAGVPFDHSDPSARTGILSARFRKRA